MMRIQGQKGQRIAVREVSDAVADEPLDLGQTVGGVGSAGQRAPAAG